MGKAARSSRRTAAPVADRPVPAPFVSRPFEGLPNETDWVALREIVPAASATVRLAPGHELTDAEGKPVTQVTLATVLPLAWPGLHRDTGEVLVAVQSGNAGGDVSRDIASAMTLTAALPAGQGLDALPPTLASTPRLQDLLDPAHPVQVTVHDGFGFWVGEADLDAESEASLERANASVIPTVKLEAAPSCYWCEIGDRDYVRWVLPWDEDTATTALARLHAAGESTLAGAELGRLLGCFRACGLLIPVWEVTAGTDPTAFEAGVTQMLERLKKAVASTEPLSAAERGARAGLTNRQVTLR